MIGLLGEHTPNTSLVLTKPQKVCLTQGILQESRVQRNACDDYTEDLGPSRMFDCLQLIYAVTFNSLLNT